MHILPIYAALLGLLFVYLSVRTIGARRRAQIAVGHGDDPALLRATRVHANFAEYTPLALLLLTLAEVQSAPGWLVHLLCLSLTIGRCVHARGVSQVNERFALRVTGMVLTFVALAGASLYLLLRALLV